MCMRYSRQGVVRGVRVVVDSSSARRQFRAVRRRVQPLPLVLLVTVWVMLWGRATWLNVIGGVVLTVGILVLLPLPPLILGVRLRLWAVVVLLLRFVVDLTVASFQVAARALQVGWQPQGRLLRVPLRSDNELIAVVNAEMNALVPGSVVVDLSPSEGWMLLHIFDAPDEESLRVALRKAQSQEERVIWALAENPQAVLRGRRRWRSVASGVEGQVQR